MLLNSPRASLRDVAFLLQKVVDAFMLICEGTPPPGENEMLRRFLEAYQDDEEEMAP